MRRSHLLIIPVWIIYLMAGCTSDNFQSGHPLSNDEIRAVLVKRGYEPIDMNRIDSSRRARKTKESENPTRGELMAYLDKFDQFKRSFKTLEIAQDSIAEAYKKEVSTAKSETEFIALRTKYRELLAKAPRPNMPTPTWSSQISE